MVATRFSVWRHVFYPLYVTILVGLAASFVYPPLLVVDGVLAVAAVAGTLVVGFIDWLRHPERNT